MATAYALKQLNSETPAREKASQLAQTTIRQHANEVDTKGRFPTEGINGLAEAGLFGLCLPSGFGGTGDAPREFAAVVEEIATECASTAMVFVMHLSGAQAIAASTTLEAKEETLKSICQGKHLTTLAFSEFGSRSQFWMPSSRLEANGDNYSISANKSWVTSASHADSFVSSAQMPDASNPMEVTLFLANPKLESVKASEGFDGLGLRGNDSVPVKIEALDVNKGDLLTEHGKGGEAMLQVVLPWFIVGTSAMAHGLCRAALSSTIKHLTTSGFEDGRKLRDLPNLRTRVAEMNVRMEQSRALLSQTVASMEAPSEETPLLVLQSRLSAIETVLEVTDLAMKACGGAAFSKHLGIERNFRDARAGWVMAPTSDHLKEFIGRALTGLPLF